MTKVKRAITVNPILDEVISMLAAENKESYSGYIESRLLMNDNIRKMFSELENLPKFPKIDMAKIKPTKEPLVVS